MLVLHNHGETKVRRSKKSSRIPSFPRALMVRILSWLPHAFPAGPGRLPACAPKNRESAARAAGSNLMRWEWPGGYTACIAGRCGRPRTSSLEENDREPCEVEPRERLDLGPGW